MNKPIKFLIFISIFAVILLIFFGGEKTEHFEITIKSPAKHGNQIQTSDKPENPPLQNYNDTNKPLSDLMDTLDTTEETQTLSVKIDLNENPFNHLTTENKSNTNDKPCSSFPAKVFLDAENILQKPSLPNGCEVVSLAIALEYAGFPIDPIVLYDDYMPKSSCSNGNPWNTYVGNAKGLGLGCYAPCIVKTGNSYLSMHKSSKKVVDISGAGFDYYENLLKSGIPVILWGTVNMYNRDDIYWERSDGNNNYVWHTYSHCLVLIGYSEDTYTFCDPLVGITEYSKESVTVSHNIMFNQACAII